MPLDPQDPQYDSVTRRNRGLFAQGARGGPPNFRRSSDPLSENQQDPRTLATRKVQEKAAKTAGAAAGAAVGGTAGAKVGEKLGEKLASGDFEDTRRKIRKVLVGTGVLAFMAQIMVVVLLMAPVGVVAAAVLGNKAGQLITGLACTADSVVSTIGLKKKSDACKARDEILDALSDSDKRLIERYADDPLRNALDCSNVTALQRQRGECIEGLLDFGEENAGPIPRRAYWLIPIWRQAAEKYNVPWELLAAINGARSNFGFINCPAGYQKDPGQGFYRQSPKVWMRYGLDAGQSRVKRDGRCFTSEPRATVKSNAEIRRDREQRLKSKVVLPGADQYDAVDATFATARMLAHQGATNPASGGGGNITGPTRPYNPSAPALVRGRISWYGGKCDPHDNNRPALWGATNDEPGVALSMSDAALGQWYEITGPNGRTITVRATDKGPHPSTGRAIDFNWSAAKLLGYKVDRNQCVKNFPTDAVATARLVRGPSSSSGVWQYNGSPAEFCTPHDKDGRVFFVPTSSVNAAPGARLGYNAKLNIPRDIVLLGAKWRGRETPMPRSAIMRMLRAVWIAFGVSPEQAQRNSELNYRRIMQESSGRPRALNTWDSNAARGTPSDGLWQFIESTFNSYKVSGFDDWLNPLDQTLAAVNAQVNATISAGRTVNGILTDGGGWSPGAWRNGSNPYATGGRAEIVDGPISSSRRGSDGTFRTVKYRGKKPTDATSRAVAYFDDNYRMSDCYVAHVHEWFEAIKANPPMGDGDVDADTIRGRIVQIAQRELRLGLKETGENCGPPLDKYWAPGVCGTNYPWCAMFQTWVWKEAGAKNDYGSFATKPHQVAYVPNLQAWGAARGMYHRPDSGYEPKPGDAATWRSGQHVNIVIRRNSNGTFSTIGGNEGDTVLYRPANTTAGLDGWVQPVKGNPRAPDAGSGTRAASKPAMQRNFIPFGADRRKQMAEYSRVHYGDASWRLNPRWIILHYTVGSADSAINTFRANTAVGPGPVMKPGVSAHFVIRKNGVIEHLVPLNVRARHTIGFNHQSIGIEIEEESSPQNIINRRAQYRAALKLVRWLQKKYGIATSRVIGHAEARTRNAYHELVAATRAGDNHTDWTTGYANRFRADL